MADVTLRNVVKRFDEVEAVRSIDLDIPDNEFIVLVGPSGCGKSTTLRMIAGLEEVSGGRDLHRRRAGQRPAAEGSRHRHGVSELRALPAHDGVREHGVRVAAAAFPEGRDPQRASRTPRASSTSPTCSTGGPSSSPAASASASPWAAPSCATPRCSCSTSRCPISTPSCACRCAPRSSACIRR